MVKIKNWVWGPLKVGPGTNKTIRRNLNRSAIKKHKLAKINVIKLFLQQVPSGGSYETMLNKTSRKL